MFIRKNTAYNTSLFSENKQNIKIYDIVSDTDVINFEDISNFYISVLSTNYLAAITKNHLLILDPLSLKEISSIPLDLNSDDQIYYMTESPNHKLQIISWNQSKNIRIMFFDLTDITHPNKLTEIQKKLSVKPNFIFHINDNYLFSFSDKVEIRDNKNFTLLQSFNFDNSFLWGIAPVSSDQFACHTNNCVYLLTKKNNKYNYEKLFGYDNKFLRSLICKNDKIIYSLENNRPDGRNSPIQICIYDLQTRKNIVTFTPSQKTQKIFSINIIDDVIALHLNHHIELWNLNKLNEVMDIIPLKKTFSGYIMLLNNMSILCCDIINHKIEMIDFPKLNAYRQKLDASIESVKPALVKDLRQIIGEYATDINVFTNIELPAAPKTSP